MRQYLDAKQQYRDSIVFFRMGDFYEIFYEDALVTARALELTLTSRSKDSAGSAIPMCGVPHHAADGYIARLVKKGFRVAICEQVEDPKKTKGLIRREVVRVVSPGTLTDASYLEEREPAFLMAINVVFGTRNADKKKLLNNGSQGIDSKMIFGTALLDLSTGEFTAAEYPGETGRQTLTDEISVINPKELILSTDFDLSVHLPDVRTSDLTLTTTEPSYFESIRAEKSLLDQFRVAGLQGFGLIGHTCAIEAAGALIQYVRHTQPGNLSHIRQVLFCQPSDKLIIDATTLRHLEVVESMTGDFSGSLLHQIDQSMTVMGGRLIRSWFLRPLCNLEPIQDRLDAVEDFAFRSTERTKIRESLKSVLDLERLVARASLGIAGPKDLIAIKQSLVPIPRIKQLVTDAHVPLIKSIVGQLDELTDLRNSIESTLIDDPGTLAREGGYIREGVDPELDKLRETSQGNKRLISQMQERERERTGITSLKIRYNRVFGYYIEVSKSNLSSVPPDYQRKQTVAGGERFIIPPLKEYEDKILTADGRILEREIDLFEQLRTQIANEASRIQASAAALAHLDVLTALAETATLYDYIKPHVHMGEESIVTEARHPVVEHSCGDAFVPNDFLLNDISHQLIVLTGPNMGGKSTYLRQVALIALLAQVGSFVPARQAKLALVDRIFARVGASDNIAKGQSTFMVEMQETANILHSASSRSLVLLDEIGRGTSTFDGLSIAWAVAEHLATNSKARPKTLFATHYHEMTDLAEALPGVINYHVVAKQWKDNVVFLRQVMPGRSNRSYGIDVARLAGLPSSVVDRARSILNALEHDELSRAGRPSLAETPEGPQLQLGLFQPSTSNNEPIIERLKSIDIDRMTPLEALTLLTELKNDTKTRG